MKKRKIYSKIWVPKNERGKKSEDGTYFKGAKFKGAQILLGNRYILYNVFTEPISYIKQIISSLANIADIEVLKFLTLNNFATQFYTKLIFIDHKFCLWRDSVF